MIASIILYNLHCISQKFIKRVQGWNESLKGSFRNYVDKQGGAGVSQITMILHNLIK